MIPMAGWAVVLIILAAFTVGASCALLCLHAGFRLGRQSIDKPLPPIIKHKATPGALVDEDPFFEPMHGREQNRPTIKEES